MIFIISNCLNIVTTPGLILILGAWWCQFFLDRHVALSIQSLYSHVTLFVSDDYMDIQKPAFEFEGIIESSE